MFSKLGIFIICLILVLLGLGGGILWAYNPLISGEKEITIEARRFAYDPSVITVNKGDKVTLNLLSTDVTHGFYLDGYEIEKEIRPWGEPAVVTFIADKAGKFNFRCSHTCGVFHPFMIGKLIVTPNYTFAGSVGLALGFLLALLYYFFAKGKMAVKRGEENVTAC